MINKLPKIIVIMFGIFILSVLLLWLTGCSKVQDKEMVEENYSTKMLGVGVLQVVQDTTVNGVWDGRGKVLQIYNYKIKGAGTLRNWDIVASQNQQIFDTSINLVNITTGDGRFSTIWYGTNSANVDNWWNIQKSMNVSIANHLECFTPGRGIYNYSKTLESAVISVGAYQQCYLHFSGDASIWDNGLGTTFQYTGVTGPAYNIQLNKGSELNNVVFLGRWKSPSTVDSVYFLTSEGSYKDISGNNLPDTYSGVTIDYHLPLDGKTTSGSTGIHIHEVGIGGFSMLLAMSQNGITANDDIMRVENLHLYDGKYGIVNGQAQEKDMEFNGVYSWGSIFEIVSIGKHGKWQAGDYSFNGANIAGRCIQLFDISVAHWFSTSITNWFAESIGSIGTFSAQMPINISNSTFDLNYNIDKNRVVISSNSNYLNISNSTIRYYDGLINNVYAHGYLTLSGTNYFGGGQLLFK